MILFASSGNPSNTLYSVRPDGSLRWKFDFEGSARSPAIGDDNTVYLAAKILYAISFDGSLRWKLDLPENATSSIAISHDGTLYFVVNDNLYSVYSNSNALAGGDWPMLQHDALHSGRQEFAITSPLREFVFGTPVSRQLEVVGGTPDFTWSVIQGGLPPGWS